MTRIRATAPNLIAAVALFVSGIATAKEAPRPMPHVTRLQDDCIHCYVVDPCLPSLDNQALCFVGRVV
jgi:hypothetical protein